MDQQIIIDNEYATLVYYPDKKIVHHTFHKPIGGKEFQAVLEAGTSLLEKHSASKWLSDDRENSALSPEDTEWSKVNWFPRTLKAGWKYWALVVPADLLGRINMKEFIDSYWEHGLRIMVTINPEEALTWLENQSVPEKA